MYCKQRVNFKILFKEKEFHTEREREKKIGKGRDLKSNS